MQQLPYALNRVVVRWPHVARVLQTPAHREYRSADRGFSTLVARGTAEALVTFDEGWG